MCVDTKENIMDLSKEAKSLGVTINIFVEFNIGQNRCGVDTFEEVLSLAKTVNEMDNLTFGGIEAYAGPMSMTMEKGLKLQKRLKRI